MFLKTNCFTNYNNSGKLSISDLNPKIMDGHPNLIFAEIKILDPNFKLINDGNFGIREEMDQGTISDLRTAFMIDGWDVDEKLICVSTCGRILDGRHRYEALKPLFPDGIPVAVYEIDSYDPDDTRDTAHYLNGKNKPTVRAKNENYVGDLLLCVKNGKVGETPSEDDIRTYAQSRAWAQQTVQGNITKIAKEVYRKYTVGEDLIRGAPGGNEKENWEEWLGDIMPIDKWKGLDPKLMHYTIVSQADQVHRPGTAMLGPIREAFVKNKTLKIILYTKHKFPKEAVKAYKAFSKALNTFVRDTHMNRKPYEIYVVPQINGRFDEEYENKQIIPLDEV
jgi:hypothetical protein